MTSQMLARYERGGDAADEEGKRWNDGWKSSPMQAPLYIWFRRPTGLGHKVGHLPPGAPGWKASGRSVPFPAVTPPVGARSSF